MNLDVDLITNGTMLNDGFLKKHGSFIRHMAISIDGQKKFMTVFGVTDLTKKP